MHVDLLSTALCVVSDLRQHCAKEDKLCSQRGTAHPPPKTERVPKKNVWSTVLHPRPSGFPVPC